MAPLISAFLFDTRTFLTISTSYYFTASLALVALRPPLTFFPPGCSVQVSTTMSMSRAASVAAEVVYDRKVLFDGLTRSDLWELLAELGHKKTEEEANVIFDILDKDGK
jgi:hypothetical protein